MTKIIGIIPARYQSSRFPGKPLFPIFGKTLLQRTFESAKKATLLDELYIATDDERIFKHAESFGAIPLMTDPECKNGTERIRDALKKNPTLQKATIVINIQGDHPCIAAKTIDNLIAALNNDSAEIATAVTPITYEEALSPHVVKCVFDHNGYALYFSRSLIPFSKTPSNVSFYYHVGIYAYKVPFLLSKYAFLKEGICQQREDLEQLKFLENGYKIKIAQVEEKPLGVDILEDVAKVEKFLCQ